MGVRATALTWNWSGDTIVTESMCPRHKLIGSATPSDDELATWTTIEPSVALQIARVRAIITLSDAMRLLSVETKFPLDNFRFDNHRAIMWCETISDGYDKCFVQLFNIYTLSQHGRGGFSVTVDSRDKRLGVTARWGTVVSVRGIVAIYSPVDGCDL